MKKSAVGLVAMLCAASAFAGWTYKNNRLYENDVPAGDTQWMLYVSSVNGTDITLQWKDNSSTYGTSTVLDLRDIKSEDGQTTYSLVSWTGNDPSCKTRVTEFIFPDTMASTGNYTFRNFTALKKVTLPAHMTSVGPQMFNGCTALEEVNGVVSAAGSSMFENCSSLTNLDASGIAAIPDSFCRTCRALKSLRLSAELTTMGYLSFQNCTSLETIEPMFAETLTNTGSGFEASTKLKGVLNIAQKNAVTIGNCAFREADFSEIIFGNQLTSLTYCSFQKTKCTKITFKGARPGSIDGTWLNQDYKVDNKYARRLYLPDIPSWTSCTNSGVAIAPWATCGKQSDYTSLYGSDELPYGLVTSQTTAFGFPRNAWVFWYTPEATGEASLVVTTGTRLSGSQPSPIYDITTKVAPGETLLCTNSVFVVKGDTLYETKGWTLQKLEGSAYVDVASGTGASYQFAPSDSESYQLVWNVEVIGYRPQVVAPFLDIGAVTTNVAATIQDEFHAPGTTLTYVAAAHGDGSFHGWYTNGVKAVDSATLTFAIDRETTVWPHFNVPYWVYNGDYLNDGAWKVATTGGAPGGPLTVGNRNWWNNATAFHDPGAMGPDRLLDLAKPIQDGSVIVELVHAAFRGRASLNEREKFTEIRLPRTLRTIGSNAFNLDTALETVVFKSCPEIDVAAFTSCSTMVWEVPGDGAWMEFIADPAKLTPWAQCNQSLWTLGKPYPVGRTVGYGGQWVRVTSKGTYIVVK